jgi:serine/threonine protein kinase
MARILEKTDEGKVSDCHILPFSSCDLKFIKLFVQTSTNIGPIRWMAPESLANQTYSKKSDVWTFGIVGL